MNDKKAILEKKTITFKGGQSLNKVYLPFATSVKRNLISFIQDVNKELSGIIQNQEISSHQKEVFKEQLSSINIHKSNFILSYLNTIKSIFQQFNTGEYNYFEKDDIENISQKDFSKGLVEADDIANKHKQNSLIRKYEKKNLEVIFKLKQIFSSITGESIDADKLPFGPFVLVSTFVKSINLLHLNMTTKTIAYNLFEECVLNNLADAYQAIILIFSQEKENVAKGSIIKDSIDDVPIGKTFFHKKDIVRALDTVQNNITITDPIAVQKALFNLIGKNDLLEDHQLDAIDKDSLNLTTMLFQQLQNDKTISELIKNILARLQIPYLKISIMDTTFIDDNQHPAKILLGYLSQSSIGWNHDDDVDGEFVNKLKEIVHSVLNEKEFTKKFFQSRIGIFEDYLDSHIITFKERQKRIADKTHGHNKIQTAMKTVDALLAYKLEGQNPPSFVEKLVLGPWKNLLVLLLVRHSNSSNEYLAKINFIDDLFDMLSSKNIELVGIKSIEIISSLYSEGLKLIAYSPEETKKKSQEFEVFLVNYQKNYVANHKENDGALNRAIDSVITKKHSKGPRLSNKKNKEHIEQHDEVSNFYKGLNNRDKKLVQSIEYDMWVDFIHNNGNKIRAKLSWINPKTSKFLFVNERGLKITDKTAQQLADDLNNKTLLIVKNETNE